MRGHCQRLAPSKVIGKVAVEAVVVARQEMEQLLVRATVGGREHFHARGEVCRHRFRLPLAKHRPARTQHVPLRLQRGGDVRLKEARLRAAGKGQVDPHLVVTSCHTRLCPFAEMVRTESGIS